MITNIWEHNGIKVRFTFFDGSSDKKFEPYTQAYAICYREDGKIIIGFNPNGYDDWLLPGGTREKEEDGVQTLKRELDEELSLEIITHKLIGAQKVEYLNKKRKPHFQLRYAAIVKEKKLTPDPDSGLLWKKKAINPKYFSKYLRWGNIGEHILNESLKWFNKNKNRKSVK